MKDPLETLLAHGAAVVMQGPEALASMFTPKKPITKARIRKYRNHVNNLIEIPRAQYFRRAGIPPVPHQLRNGNVAGQLTATTQLWLTLRDRLGKEAADEHIRQTSRFLAKQDASRTQAENGEL